MLKSINRSCKKIWCLLLRVLSYLLIKFSSWIMIPRIQLNLQSSGCLKIILMFCNGQVSPWIWIQLRTCGNFWKFKSKKEHQQTSIIWRQYARKNGIKYLLIICKKLIENYWKRLVAVEVNKDYSTMYSMKIMHYFLYCTITFFTHENE